MDVARHPGTWGRMRASIPHSTRLSEDEWASRHRIVVRLLWLHVPLIIGFGVYMGEGLGHSAFEGSIVLVAAALATADLPLPQRWQARRHSIRATIGGFGLMSASAVLTHLSGGYIEMHFHFFVMVAVMALYQDWPPFILAITFVALHHGMAGVLDPGSVYNHPDALANPWKWAGIHAVFILAASAAAVTTWHYADHARRKTEVANTEMEHAISRLNATLDATADGILVVDGKGRITSHNQQFADMWRIPADVLAEQDDEKAIRHVLGQLKDPAAFVAKVEDLYARPDDESFDTLDFEDGRVFERYSKPQRLGDNVVGRVWSFRDVTERKRAEEHRVLAGQRLMDIQRLEEVNQFKTALLNTASHELNTPLTPLLLQLHLLQKPDSGPLTERQQKAVHVLDRNLGRLSDLVRNVLDVARLQSHQLRIDPQPLDVQGLLRESIESFEEVARHADVRLTSVVSRHACRMPANGDVGRLTQVLVNLLSNALKFTPAGGEVRVMARDTPTGVHIAVQDTGRGLTAAEQGQLFQPFAQVGDVAHENPAGTGLGLYICKGIIEAHGGQIGVDSRGPRHGATFWFTVPYAGPVARSARDGRPPRPALGASPMERRQTTRP